MVRFISRFIGSTEWCDITVNNILIGKARRVESFNPFWIMYDKLGNETGEFESLKAMKTEIESNGG